MVKKSFYLILEHHYYHQITVTSLIFLTLSLSLSLSFSLSLHPFLSTPLPQEVFQTTSFVRTELMQVLASWSALAHTCVGVH